VSAALAPAQEVAIEGPRPSAKTYLRRKADLQAQQLHAQSQAAQLSASNGRKFVAPGSAQAGTWTMCASQAAGDEVASEDAPGSRRLAIAQGECSDYVLETWSASPAALAAAVPKDLSSLPGMKGKRYKEVVDNWGENPPHFNGEEVRLEHIATFMQDVLSSDPFGTGDQVPFVDFSPLAEADGGQVVAITQRQLAFVVANALMGNTIPAGDGLSAALDRCAGRATGYIYSLLSLLGVLSRELAGGGAGTFLVAMTPISPAKDAWREKLETSTLSEPELCTNLGGQIECPVNDFMAGGVYNQALTDIAGRVVGGGGELCDLAYSQDESLVQFYPETLAFAFFAGGGAMINVPWTVLGARRYLDDLSGQTSVSAPMSGHCGLLKETDWLNQGMLSKTENVVVAGGEMTVYSTAFVAVASEVTEGCDDGGAKNNNCDTQRRHLDEDVSLWYQAFEPSQYHPAVRDALAGVVYRVGTGPWGAGAWWGDSQISFLTVWLATSLVHGISLDYYIYDHFCENPANQCFLLGGDECRSCVRSGESGDSNGPTEERCGERSIFDLVKQFRGHTAKELYDKLIHIPGPPSQVFDVL